MSQLKRLMGVSAAVGATAAVLAVTAVSPTLAAPRPGEPSAAPRADAPSAASPPAAATPQAEDRKLAAVAVPRLRWTGCGADLKAFQCATATVPLDYDEPHGPTITLALTRLPATDRSHRIGSLFTNPGGPGGSGVDFVQQSASVLYSRQVRARFDIIGFDPRGVSRSTPATCFATPAKEEAALSGDLPFPLVRRQLSRMNRETAALARACARTSAERLRHMSTANVARDLDLLRRAVGDAKLSYAGYSYGTYLGATYAKLFPSRIRAMVLDGTLDPREYTGTAARFRGIPVGQRVEQDRGGAEVFEQFLRLCRRAGPTDCSLAGLGDPATVTRGLFDAIKNHPIDLPDPDTGTFTVTYQYLVVAIYSTLYSPANWADLADVLTALASRAAVDRKAAAATAGPLPVGAAALLRRTDARGEDYASVGGVIGSTCVDTVAPPRRGYPAAASAADRRYPEFGRYRTWIDYVCTYLHDRGITDTDAYADGWRQTTRAPVLVLGTRHDPATPYRNTRPYAALFPRATVVTLNGWGHTTLGQSRCTDAAVTAYLVDPRHRADSVCPTDVKPFAGISTANRERSKARSTIQAQPWWPGAGPAPRASSQAR